MLEAIKCRLRAYYRGRMQHATRLNDAVLACPAIIFAPHPDDETLACGGTILRKKQAGAALRVVFMTDGSDSHSGAMPREQLKAIRTGEAQSACARLGLQPNEVIFLDFSDGHLLECQTEAAAKIKTLLLSFQAEQIFIPFHAEPPTDHVATNHIVRMALASLPAGYQPDVYEYPVWYWYHWPWVRLRQGRRPDTLTVLRQTLQTLAGLRMMAEFRYAVDISSVLDAKRAALQEHRSQTTRLLPDRHWPVLADVSGGEFLDCFFTGHEYYYRRA